MSSGDNGFELSPLDFFLPAEKEFDLFSADVPLKRILLRKQYNTLDLLDRSCALTGDLLMALDRAFRKFIPSASADSGNLAPTRFRFPTLR